MKQNNHAEPMPTTAAANPLTPEQRAELIAQIMRMLDRLTGDQQRKAISYSIKLTEQQGILSMQLACLRNDAER